MAVTPSIRPLRGTTDKLEAYKATAKVGELLINTQTWALALMDGAGNVHYSAKADSAVTGDTVVLVNAGTNGTVGAPVALSFSATAAAAALLSTDAGNGLGLGTDNLLKVTSADGLVAENDELLHVDASGKIATGLELDYNTATGEFSVTNHAGTKVASVTVPTSTSVLRNVDIVVDPSGQPAGTYFEFTWDTADGAGKTLYVDMAQFFDVYTGGDGITVTGKVITVNAKADGGVVADAGGISVDFTKGISGDAGNLIAAGSDSKLLVKPYTAGSGITVDTGTQVVSAKLSTDAGNAVSFGTDGGLMVAAGVTYTAGDGIAIGADHKIAVNLSTAEGQMATIVGGALMVSSDFGELE